MVLEFRINQTLTDNMPNSSGILQQYAVGRSVTCSSEQCLLLRYTVPREGGERIAGAGTAEVAVGHYNCDGTFSFYGDEAAPDRAEWGFTDPARWQTRIATTMIDPTKDGVEQSEVTGMNPNRKLSCNPFYVDGSEDISWELCTRGFQLLEVDTSVEARDGIGEWDGMAWTRPGKYEVYAPISANDTDMIDSIDITFCQLTAFGPIAPEYRAELTCTGAERCLPLNPIPTAQADRTCPWVKLPDSLCPEDDDEAEIFGCHLGTVENVNNEADYPEVTCTPEEPTEPLPDRQGQCCDPLGQSDDLPACNAFRIVNSFASSAAEITTEPANKLQPVCE